MNVERAQVGRDQDVGRLEQRELRADVLLGQDVEHLRRVPRRRLQLVARHQRRADVDRDDDVGAHRAHHVDRQVVDEAAVAQDPAVDLDRREHARHRHAGAHRLVQRPRSNTTFLPVTMSVATARIRIGSLSKLSTLSTLRVSSCRKSSRFCRQRALEPQELAVADSRFRTRVETCCSSLRRKPTSRRAGLSENSVGQLDRGQLPLHLGGRHAAGVEAADDRAHDVAAM